jgi:two-component system alkaline phosphatase synthesis response regulator PhoP
LPKLLLIADDYHKIRRLSSELSDRGFDCLIAVDNEMTAKKVIERSPDLLLVAINGVRDSAGVKYLAKRGKGQGHPPVIGLLSIENLDNIDPSLPIDDFVVKPWDASEIALRARRALRQYNGAGSSRSIECGDLIIDLDNCEVTVSGKLVVLTFREYELLKFLASNKGNVFTRCMLLDEVWGHDYFGGDRTVDVHIRRLRSKIEDSDHTFIDTVRNMGYRFRKKV